MLSRIRGIELGCALIFSCLIAQLHSAERVPAGNQSLKNEIDLAIQRGTAWLATNQQGAGHWSNPEQPAISALALVALQGAEDKRAQAIEKGYKFLLTNVKPDGSIHGGKGLVNYNTSLGLLALAAAPDGRYKEQILRARHYLIGTQIDMGEKGKLDSPFDGGVGYGSRYEHSDLANTVQALEALSVTKLYAADSANKEGLNWKAAIHFLQSCQNLPTYNKEPWASDDPQNKGGFIYYPGNSMAGETNINGRVAFRSYGSISYAGLLSYIYADLKKDDPRVQAVLDWLKRNYTLDENPGMGPQGIYYYFQMMTKALSIYGIDQLPTEKGAVNWREKLALRLLDLQKPDGSWVNESARWMEKDPALVTSYSLISLEFIARAL